MLCTSPYFGGCLFKFPHNNIFLELGSPQTNAIFWVWSHRSWNRGGCPAGSTCTDADQHVAAAQGTLLICVQLVCQTPLLSCCMPASLSQLLCSISLPYPGGEAWHLPLNFMRFLLAHSFSLSSRISSFPSSSPV